MSPKRKPRISVLPHQWVAGHTNESLAGVTIKIGNTFKYLPPENAIALIDEIADPLESQEGKK